MCDRIASMRVLCSSSFIRRAIGHLLGVMRVYEESATLQFRGRARTSEYMLKMMTPI